MKKTIPLIILLFPFLLFATTQSTTTRGITIDGNVTTSSSNGDNDNDWEPNEVMGATDGVTWYLSWDDVNLYIGRVGGNNAEPQLIYIQAEYAGSTYTATPTSYDAFTPNFTNMTGINFALYTKSSYDEFRTYSSGSWSAANTSLTVNYSSNMEVSIPWNTITNGNGKPIHFRPVFYNTNGNSGSLYAYGTSPTGNPTAFVNTPTITNWWGGYDVIGGIAPNTNTNNPLPVELTTFKATPRANTVILEWTTASETNNSHFDIEKSSDAKNWSLLGTLSGRGTTAIQNQYFFPDENPSTGNNYYRLKQVDFDGRFEYSNIVLAKIAHGAADIYPNPVTQELFIPSENAYEGDAVEIYSLQGTLVKTVSVSNNSSTILDCTPLSDGVYLLHIRDAYGAVKSSQRFVKH
jgi:Secretion system C-terminal sorting domain